MTTQPKQFPSYFCLAIFPIIFCGFYISVVSADDWDAYGGPGGQQYTNLDQIHAGNLEQLQRAWVFQTGDLNQGFEHKTHSLQSNPIFWNETLYLSTSSNLAIAVDAATGEELWRFDPQLPKNIDYAENASRGVSIWHGNSDECPHRIFLGTLQGHIFALDARTGEPCRGFANSGIADLSVGVGEVSIGEYGITSPPAVIGDQLIVGSAIGDNRAALQERGIVRALDAKSGAINWLWDPIPGSAEEPNWSGWEDGSGSRTGSANAWAPITVDESLGLVYVSTSSPSPDFYGGERLGDNRHANSLVALNARNGELVWSQQLVHHDVWDYDIPAQPTLTTINFEGRQWDAVVVVSKTGMLYAFDRATGEAIYEIIERPVPQSTVPGERLSPTQPFSSIPPLVNQLPITPQDAWGVLGFDKLGCQRIIRRSVSQGIFTPISLEGTIMNPGYAGGANWGGVAIDSDRQIAIVNVNQIPALVKLIPRPELQARMEAGEFEGDWEVARQEGTPYAMARRLFLSAIGLPCTKPPWGKLVAVDLGAGTILWDVPLGTIRNLAPAIVPNFKWGIPNIGGALLTGSGLIFIGAAAEHRVRIFDINNGEELWRHNLPAAAIATPMSYEVNGEQFIAITAGGNDNFGLERADYLISFKLQDEENQTAEQIK